MDCGCVRGAAAAAAKRGCCCNRVTQWRFAGTDWIGLCLGAEASSVRAVCPATATDDAVAAGCSARVPHVRGGVLRGAARRAAATRRVRARVPRARRGGEGRRRRGDKVRGGGGGWGARARVRVPVCVLLPVGAHRASRRCANDRHVGAGGSAAGSRCCASRGCVSGGPRRCVPHGILCSLVLALAFACRIHSGCGDARFSSHCTSSHHRPWKTRRDWGARVAASPRLAPLALL